MEQTPLSDVHRSLGARMVEFAGYEMPVQYTSIVEEHRAVREAAGLFDVSHMGRILITGPDRVRFLDSLVTNQVRGLPTGAARYALALDERGTVLDDVIYYSYPELLLLVVNAGNRAKIAAWLEARRAGFDVSIDDVSASWAMIAIQGPLATEVLAPLADVDLGRIQRYASAGGTVLGIPSIVARTGYTGEDGFELYFDAARAPHVWRGLLAAGRDRGVLPCGLGSRDTLRLEAAMPLYGHELDEETNPLEAGLDFAVKFDKGEFVGRGALVAARERGLAKRLAGFTVDGKRIPRQGHEVFRAGSDEPCGVVTSGTFSPTFERGLCLAWIRGPIEGAFEVAIGKQRLPLTAAALPFYRRPREKKVLV